MEVGGKWCNLAPIKTFHHLWHLTLEDIMVCDRPFFCFLILLFLHWKYWLFHIFSIGMVLISDVDCWIVSLVMLGRIRKFSLDPGLQLFIAIVPLKEMLVDFESEEGDLIVWLNTPCLDDHNFPPCLTIRKSPPYNWFGPFGFLSFFFLVNKKWVESLSLSLCISNPPFRWEEILFVLVDPPFSIELY